MIRNESFSGGVCIAAEVVDLDAGTVTVERDGQVVESRPLTAAELDVYVNQPKAEANRTAIEDKAAAALTANATFLALTSPTNARTLAQVKALTRQNTAIIRLLLNKLDTDEGT